MLVVDDDPGSSGLLRDIFQQEGYDVTLAQRGEEALALAPARPFDVVLCDVQLPDVDGIELLRRLKRVAPTTAVIMVTAFGTYETAIKALHEGAFDYVRKPFTLQEVRLTVERAMERRRLQKSAAANAPAADGEARPIIGRNQAMVELFKLVSRVAATKSSVLIQGESGTGKELIARTIHQGSPRASGPFIAVNVTSLSETLLESELFGHVKGAFTGAIERRPGLFVEANRGTIFLDEVGDMSLPMQAKLLRVLQEHELKPVGGNETIPVDVRMVAATHQDLEELVRAGRFREDLYYRLNVIPITLPPLRDRRDDIPLLAKHFLEKFSPAAPMQASQGAMRLLMSYGWPGNVRQLENAIERAVALSAGRKEIEVSDLPPEIQSVPPPTTTPFVEFPDEGLDLPSYLSRIEQDLIGRALDRTGGNRNRAAELLRIKRTTLVEKLKRMGQ
jgi:DNA-binding NtrC family response regulator